MYVGRFSSVSRTNIVIIDWPMSEKFAGSCSSKISQPSIP